MTLKTVPSKLAPGALVRWRGGDNDRWGVATALAPNGRRATVHFDDGETLEFAWPADNLERVVFEPGQPVKLEATEERANVAEVIASGERVLYVVSLADGSSKTVTEDGVRIAIETDPLAQMRNGNLDSARSVNLRTAATRLLFAHQYDELSSLSNSRVEIKPHQVAVLHRVASTFPHRFILADEVGLGKTIEAGLIIKELQARGFAGRVLVIAPSGIVSQWQYELKTKFNMPFADYRRATIDFLESENPGENVWALRDHVICSTTFAAWSEDRRREIALAGWDMVVIDEAHHARRTWQGEHKHTETNLYKLAEMLADPDMGRAQSFLLLTATPMQLHRYELYSLIELLDPALFPTFDDFDEHADALAGLNAATESVRRWPTLDSDDQAETENAVRPWISRNGDLRGELQDDAGRERLVEELRSKHRLSEVLIRNRKKVVGGFMPRVAALWPVELSEQEWEAYHAVSEYVRTGYARSRAQQNNALGFLMVIFQKLNTSSSFALRQSLLRRIEKLEGGLRPTSDKVAVEEADLEEKPIEEALDKMMGASSHAAKLDRAEISDLENLVRLLDRILLDSKAKVLIERLGEIAETQSDPKVIIFTQFRDTQDYLRGHIPEPWSVNLFHGQLKPHEKDMAIERFRESGGAQILISTEAGGEGRNFQFCDMLVNYDLPWNPMKVEQRIGRIDRIGQKRPVKVFNFSTLGTVEERLVDVLGNRIGVFEQTIGGLDPILGEVEHDLRKIFVMAQDEADRTLADLEKQIGARVQQARRAEQQLADLIMDAKSFRKDEVEDLLARRGSTSSNDMRKFVLNALSELDVTSSEDDAIRGLYHLRFGPRFSAAFPQFAKEELRPRVTFDAAVALDHEEVEFLAFGHPLVDSVVERARSSDYPARASHRIVLTDEIDPCEGWLFLYVLEFGGLVPVKELYAAFVSSDGTEDDEVASLLLRRACDGKREEWGVRPPLPQRDEGFEGALETADKRALARLVERQGELMTTNQGRLNSERAKLERFYDYRLKAETEKVAAVETVFSRLSESDDPGVQRILPVWAKKLETARRTLENTGEQRERRLQDLTHLERVAAQHERLIVSYVEIRPDVKDHVDSQGLDRRLLDRLRAMARPTTAAELEQRLESLRGHIKKLEALGERLPGKFDPRPALDLANELMTAIEGNGSLDDADRALVRGAVDYFMLIEDAEHDLGPSGFNDDRSIIQAVLKSLGSHVGRPDAH
jgi:superfamily II DNA or RNA helicase